MQDEIDVLVEEFNKTEDEQARRMVQLYDLLNARRGYRRVNFGHNHLWSNCWNYGDRRDLAIAAHVAPYIHLIVDYDKGDPVQVETVEGVTV